MGRPTSYKPEYCEEIVEFFNQEPYEIVKSKTGADKRIGRKLPTIVGFAKHIKVGISTVYDWISPSHNSYQKIFSDTYKHKAQKLQAECLIQGGLLNIYNPLFAKFVLVNVSDMRDQQAIDLSGELKTGFKEMTDDEIIKQASTRGIDLPTELARGNAAESSKEQD